MNVADRRDKKGNKARAFEEWHRLLIYSFSLRYALCFTQSFFNKQGVTKPTYKILKSLLPRPVTRPGCPIAPWLFNIIIEILALVIRQEKEVKDNWDCKRN